MKYLQTVLLLLLAAVTVRAQSFLGGGLSFGSIVGDGYNGQDKSIGGFGEATLSRKFGIRFDATGLATLEFAPKDTTTSWFDLRLRPEIRAFAPLPGQIAPFVGAGVQYSYFNSDQYGKSGLNYVGTVGAEIYRAHTASVSRLFTDRTNFNENRLEGWRYGYDLTKRFSGSPWAIRFSGEYNRFRYVQPFGLNQGSYAGQSLAFRLGIAKAY